FFTEYRGTAKKNGDLVEDVCATKPLNQHRRSDAECYCFPSILGGVFCCLDRFRYRHPAHRIGARPLASASLRQLPTALLINP
ncbi:hypothetical protein ACM792_29065, partial [Metapseudomonas otitidis]|uniref:hypothetical protein n=1 Tax=Metapseudomonas otitidis TaxID=319939 RepID=UPI0039FC7CB0